MTVSFTAEIIDISGKKITPIEKVISIEAARSFNTAGSAVMVIPDSMRRDIFKYNTRMRLWRRGLDGTSGLFGDTIWFARKMKHNHRDRTYTIEWEDSFSLLNLRLVAYTSDTVYADKTIETFDLIVPDDRLRIDNMMRQYVRENYGTESEDINRRNLLITVEEDRSRGPYGSKTAAWQRLGDTLLDLARMGAEKGMELFFDLVPQPNGTFMFKVWDTVRNVNRGSNSGSVLTLSEHLNHLSEVEEVDDYSNLGTYVYVLGLGSGPSQIIEDVGNEAQIRADPFGRIEYTISDSEVSLEETLLDMGRASLRGRRPKRVVSARVVDGSGVIYGRNYSYGDRVLAHIGNRKYNCHVNAVRTRWAAGVEDLEIRITGEEDNEYRVTQFTPPVPDDPPVSNDPPVVSAGVDQEI